MRCAYVTNKPATLSVGAMPLNELNLVVENDSNNPEPNKISLYETEIDRVNSMHSARIHTHTHTRALLFTCKADS